MAVPTDPKRGGCYIAHVQIVARGRNAALLHGGDRIRVCTNPQRLMSPHLRCGRISGVQHPAFG
jgi:hypothetical protein